MPLDTKIEKKNGLQYIYETEKENGKPVYGTYSAVDAAVCNYHSDIFVSGRLYID